MEWFSLDGSVNFKTKMIEGTSHVGIYMESSQLRTAKV